MTKTTPRSKTCFWDAQAPTRKKAEKLLRKKVEKLPRKKAEKLLKKAATLPDGPERKKVWAEVQQTIRHDLPVIFLIEIGYTHIWNKRVHGLITNGVSMYSNWDSVWVE